MLTDIQNSFIDALSDKFATKVHLNIPLHIKYVAITNLLLSLAVKEF